MTRLLNYTIGTSLVATALLVLKFISINVYKIFLGHSNDHCMVYIFVDFYNTWIFM